jgi:hypothetical protein
VEGNFRAASLFAMTNQASGPASRAERLAAGLLVAIVVGAFLAAAIVLIPFGMVGFTRDDAVYTLATRALLAGLGYVDLCFPDHPGAFRFPPGFSLLLLPFMAGGGDVVAQLHRAQLAVPLAAVAFMLLAYRYFRTQGALSPLASAACTAWIAAQPQFLAHTARVMADVPFAALGLAGIMAFEAAGSGLAAWAGVGLLLGFTVLVRYAGVALVLAAGLVLVRRRAWRQLAGLVAGCGGLVLPWLAYRQVLGGSDYAQTYGMLMPHDPAALVKAASIVAAGFFGNAVPGMLFGGWFQSMGPLVLSPLVLVVGLAVGAVVLAGLARGVARPANGTSGLAELYALLTFAMVATYALGFTWYADNFMQRAFIPLLPILALAALRTLGARHRLQALVVGLGTASQVHGSLIVLVVLWTPPVVTRSYFQAFDAIRRLTPPAAVLMATENHMITLYTDRYCETVPNYNAGVGANPRAASARQAVTAMARHQVRYLVGTPVYEWGEGRDRSIALVNDLIMEAPGLLREAWLGPTRRFGLWEVDPRRLELLAR